MTDDGLVEYPLNVPATQLSGAPFRNVLPRHTWGGRRNGRATMQRWALHQNLVLSGHVHVVGQDGLWCVTGDLEQLRTLGPLWCKIRQPCPDRVR